MVGAEIVDSGGCVFAGCPGRVVVVSFVVVIWAWVVCTFVVIAWIVVVWVWVVCVSVVWTIAARL
jgi:hypothetical protein